MKKNILIKIISFLLPLLLISGCLKDDTNPAGTFETTDTISMLNYFELNGDVINTGRTMNVFVSASELYSNLQRYAVYDMRDSLSFVDGHIEGAINIKSSNLLVRAKNENTKDVIIVSQTGQAASYYAGLLRLDGLYYIYVLKFGMAGWNSHFATQWSMNSGVRPSGFKYFNSVTYNKGPYTNLPSVNLSGSGDIKSKIETRIQSLLSEKFDEGVDIEDSSIQTAKSIDVFNAGIFSVADSTFGDQYIACYDGLTVYGGGHDATIPMHSPHSVQYTQYGSLESVHDLQTIPSNKNVVIYSLSGHQSAFVTAYLRLLGYNNVRTLLFGATWLNPFPGSMSYPYVN